MNIESYRQRLHLQDATFSRIDHEDAMIAIVYKITQPNGEQLILKISPRSEDYRREVYFLQYFANKLPVPRILQLVPPEESLQGAILMEYLQGTLLKSTHFPDAVAYEIGSALAQIHMHRVDGYGDLTKPHPLHRDVSTYFTQKFEEELAECSHHLPRTMLEQCRSYYDKHEDLLASVDGPCIVHRDFRPGNLIVCEGKLKGIIDWAGARGGFAEQDFCPMEHSEWSLHPNSKKSFLTGYASVRPVPDYSAIMPLLRLSKAIAVIGFTVKAGTWENKDARAYKFNRRFLDTFLFG